VAASGQDQKPKRAPRASLYRMAPIWPYGDKQATQMMVFGYTDIP